MLDELKELGVNVEEGVERLGGNAAIYEKMLGSFLKMMKSYVVPLDFDGENYGDVIETAHAIKGAAGNLSVSPIYDSYAEIVNLLRSGQPQEARAVLKEILPVQEKIADAIERYTSDK